MMRTLGKHFWRKQRRRFCSGATLLAYLASAIGFPIPATSAKPATACGQQVCCCGTPEQCRASGCGCPHQHAPAPAPSEDDVPNCCAKKKLEPNPSCCIKEGAKKTPGKAKALRWVVGIAAQKCRGGPSQWLGADVALPLSLPTAWQPDLPYCHSLPVTQDAFFALAEDLLDPPPRREAM